MCQNNVNMVEKTVLVQYNKNSRPVTFRSQSNSQEEVAAIKIAIKRVYRDILLSQEQIFVQVKDESWGGMFVDI